MCRAVWLEAEPRLRPKRRGWRRRARAHYLISKTCSHPDPDGAGWARMVVGYFAFIYGDVELSNKHLERPPAW